MASLFIRLHPRDSVVVAIEDLAPGAALSEIGVVCKDAIPLGHKVAIKAIAVGEPVRKFDQIIGFATKAIAPGEHVHVHNMGMGEDFDRTFEIGSGVHPSDVLPESQRATFQGIVRPNGQVATRNYIGVLTTVNCSATAARLVADQFRGPALEAFPNVDGVVALTHSLGCGGVQEGDGMDILRRTIGGYANHPNFGAVVIIGLGCENNQLSRLLEVQGLEVSDTLQPLIIQDVGGTAATVKEAVARIKAILPKVNDVHRQTVSASHITVGLQCGASDGYSGITANPALGAAVDLLVKNGGTAVLSETPEIYGAEHLLARRAIDGATARKLVERIEWWEAYTARTGDEMNNNPSPGNKKGGLTTILEKSLGAVAKAGTTNLIDVVKYAEPVKSHGLVFMDTPGYDPVSATGQVAGGANVICFTTGRGSVFGCKPAPSLKLATNTPLFNRMRDDMDINCGPIATGEATIEEIGKAIFEAILATASGKQTKSEELGVGADEFAPWQIGAVM
ncbi:altronate dehydratase family protein [Telmatospirillum sp.]|uniref:UxaA family hydrolase n=1 Tax=Telmatospirillum sp. TaxID=2079197 RepID=UPI00284E1F28|nr:altronate dehydratase family protein [Telmatospirillum sp.]MDR3435347.1 altronate dehydratase family protein [Telmatospirillum sp.]